MPKVMKVYSFNWTEDWEENIRAKDEIEARKIFAKRFKHVDMEDVDVGKFQDFDRFDQAEYHWDKDGVCRDEIKSLGY